MSKTNHRVNKDRGEKLREAKAHKQRRNFKVKSHQLVDIYEENPEALDDFYDEEFETHEKIKRVK